MNQVLSLCLAINLVYAQAAVTRDPWFGIDKLKHFFISAFVESVSFSALQAAGANRRAAFAGGIAAAAAVGLGREIHDKRTPGKWFSYRDLTWDAIGIGAGAALLSHTIK
jgi:putative lipoprotein